jgi:RimJ/RimL family protein N-acetyltransferase
MIAIKSSRTLIKPFTPVDTGDVFECMTPSMTRFMSWEPPASPADFAQLWKSWLPSIHNRTDFHFVVRSSTDGRCLGVVGLHAASTPHPELGIWLREDIHGQGFGREVIGAVLAWTTKSVEPEYFEYPVAEENLASRRIAEAYGGWVAERRCHPKYVSVVYHIPAARSQNS